MNYDPNITLQKNHNAEVFQETMRICHYGSYVAPSGIRVDLAPLAEMLAASVFHETAPNVRSRPQVAKSAVDVVKEDCIDAAHKFEDHNSRNTNFAAFAKVLESQS